MLAAALRADPLGAQQALEAQAAAVVAGAFAEDPTIPFNPSELAMGIAAVSLDRSEDDGSFAALEAALTRLQ